MMHYTPNGQRARGETYLASWYFDAAANTHTHTHPPPHTHTRAGPARWLVNQKCPGDRARAADAQLHTHRTAYQYHSNTAKVASISVHSRKRKEVVRNAAHARTNY